MPARPQRLSLIVIVLILAGTVATACSPSPAAGAAEHAVPMAPMDGMPGEVQSAPAPVQQAYQYAAANPETLKQIPCYCGCGNMGHTSNYSCYVEKAEATGKVTAYDSHALGCSICVDITQDVIRLQKQGKSVPDIRAYVDGKYAKYGPSNIP